MTTPLARPDPRDAVALVGCRAAAPGTTARRHRPRRPRRPVAPAASPLDRRRRPPSASPSAGRRVQTVRLALDWTPNTNHPGSSSRRRRAGTRDAGVELQILPYATATPETILAAHQAECGISFQDSLTFAVAAGARHRQRRWRSSSTPRRRSPSSPSSPIQRPRDLDGKTYAGFGYPERGADAQGGDPGRRRQGRLHERRRSTPPPTRRCTSKQADFAIRSRPGRASRPTQRGIELRDLPVHRLRLPGLLPGRPRLRPRLARARTRTPRRRSSAATVRGFEFAAAEPGRRRADPRRRRTRACSTRTRTCRRRAPGSSPSGGYLVDASGKAGTQTLESGRATRGSCTTRGC